MTAASVRLRGYGFEAPGDPRTHQHCADGQTVSPERFEFIDAAIDNDAIKQKARRRLEAAVAQGPRLEGSTNLPSPVPGFVAGFADLPEAERDREQEHIFIEVIHRGQPAGTYANHFEAASIRPSFRIPPTADHPRIRGIQTAWVAGPSSQEGAHHCDQHGRVQLRFHWQDDFRLETAPWARVAQTLAGPGWGFLSLPRVGNEVLVAFADGDPERPVVIGSLHNGVSVPPQKLPDHAARTTIRSRSLDGGSGHNEIVLDDTAGAERISIRAEKDREVLVQRDDRLEIKGERTVRTTGKDLAEAAEIELSATRSLTLRCGGSTIRITPSAISIDAPIVKLNS
jgi:type VI secretion system secreted protein VgrG